MQLRVSLQEGEGKFSRELNFPEFWLKLVDAWISTGHAPSGRGSNRGKGSTPRWPVSQGVHLCFQVLNLFGSPRLQRIPVLAQQIDPSKKRMILVPYR